VGCAFPRVGHEIPLEPADPARDLGDPKTFFGCFQSLLDLVPAGPILAHATSTENPAENCLCSGHRPHFAEVSSPEDLAGAILALANQGVDVVIAMQTSILSERRQIAGLAAENRLPVIYGYREHVDAGGLISYGVDLRLCFHHAATFVHKILNGAAPGDLPVEFPPRLEMVVNLKTAKALDLTIPAAASHSA
jgi:hypothetical protein